MRGTGRSSDGNTPSRLSMPFDSYHSLFFLKVLWLIYYNKQYDLEAVARFLSVSGSGVGNEELVRDV